MRKSDTCTCIFLYIIDNFSFLTCITVLHLSQDLENYILELIPTLPQVFVVNLLGNKL